MSRIHIASKTRRVVVQSLIALSLTLSAGSFVAAEDLQGGPPQVVWDKDVTALPYDTIFENGQNQVLSANLQNDQIVIHSINSNGVKNPKLSFSKQGLGYLAGFHQTQGGGYMAVGGATVLKVNYQGNKDWEYTLQYPNTYLVSVDQLNEGSYIVAGTTAGTQGQERDVVVSKLSGNGTLIWEKKFIKPTEDSVKLVRHTSDGGFIVLGETGGNSPSVWIAKFTNRSKLEWERNLTVAGDTENLWSTALVEGDDGYGITGFYNHPHPNGGVRNLTTGFILKTDTSGNLLWSQPLASQWDRSQLNDIQLAADGGYVVTGKVNEDWHGTQSKEFVEKMDTSGNLVWSTIINRTQLINRGVFIQPLNNGYLVIGQANETIKATKLAGN